eukprot:15455175-Alexandrium_andersonii.AAC.1
MLTGGAWRWCEPARRLATATAPKPPSSPPSPRATKMSLRQPIRVARSSKHKHRCMSQRSHLTPRNQPCAAFISKHGGSTQA